MVKSIYTGGDRKKSNLKNREPHSTESLLLLQLLLLSLTATLELVLSPVAVFLHVAQQIGSYALAVRASKHARAACCHRRSASRRFGGHCNTKTGTKRLTHTVVKFKHPKTKAGRRPTRACTLWALLRRVHNKRHTAI